ncbi:ankyrin repeat-containing domain protein [Mycena crocata]|nr:ankyrin repeat-containing domain protein [Mycena crocata]
MVKKRHFPLGPGPGGFGVLWMWDASNPPSILPRIIDDSQLKGSFRGRIFKRNRDEKTDTDRYLEVRETVSWRRFFKRNKLETIKEAIKTSAQGVFRETTGISDEQNTTENLPQRPDAGDSPTFKVAYEKASQDSSQEVTDELKNSTETLTQPPDTEEAPESEPDPTTSAKDSIVSNISAVLDVVQQVGKILESVPFVEPIGAILSTAVNVYKEVDSNSGERDALSEKTDALNGGVAKAMAWLEKDNQFERASSLKSDVDDYMRKLEEVHQLLTVDHGRFNRIINRGKIGAELDLLEKRLDRFGEIFKTKCLIDIRKKQHEIVRGVAETQQVLVKTQKAVIDFISGTERDKIIDWLSRINFFTQQADILRCRQPGTGEWLLQNDTFRRWEAESGRILWGRGIPGAGKTVVASVVVDHLAKATENDNVGVACIYLSHKDTDTQTPYNLLAAVWRQLVLRKPIAAGSKVQELFRAHSEKRTRPELAEIDEVLRSAVIEWTKVYIVVDALDETPEGNRHTLLNYLTNLGPAVCLMLTSRHDVSLPKINADTLEIRVPEGDIQTYLKEQINRSTRLTSVLAGNSELRDEIVSKVQSNADRMFLLARLHVESFESCSSVADIRDTLDNLSANLDAAYGKVMERIGRQSERDKKLANVVLTWVSNAKRPLSVEELREALAVERGAKRHNPEKRRPIAIILSVCAGLVVVDEESSTVRLVHFTTQDYLNGRFPEAHTEITCTLLTYISFDEFNIIPQRDKTAANRYSLLEYCQYCLLHAQNANLPKQFRSVLVSFLRRASKWHQYWRYSAEGSACPWDYPAWPKSASPLWVAAATDLLEIITYLLESGIPPNGAEKQDGTPLSVASFYGHAHMAKLLIEKGADVHVGDDKALREASKRGHAKLVSLLLKNGASVHALDDGALREASKGGCTEIVRLLLENDASVHALDDAALREASKGGYNDIDRLLLENGADIDAGDDRASCVASRNGHTEVVRILLENGADIDAGEDFCALEEASIWGQIKVAQLLLEKGADIHARDDAAWRAAFMFGNTIFVQLLLEWKADVHTGNDAALRAASEHGYTELVNLLLEKGADVHAEHDGALRAASERGRIQVVQILIEHGADVHAENDYALRAAAEKGHTEVVQILLENGANVHAEENVALRAASRNYSREIVKLLLEHGANVHAADNGALRAASKNHSPQVVQLLLQHGADIHAKNDAALRAASMIGRAEVVRLLLKKGADVNANNSMALREASSRGHTEVVRLLLKSGADVSAADGQVTSPLEAAAGWDGLEDSPETNSSQSLEQRREQWEIGGVNPAAKRLELVRILLKHGADVRARKNGALRAAHKAGYPEVVELLLEHRRQSTRGPLAQD